MKVARSIQAWWCSVHLSAVPHSSVPLYQLCKRRWIYPFLIMPWRGPVGCSWVGVQLICSFKACVPSFLCPSARCSLCLCAFGSQTIDAP
jgi:hypothetical protein